MSYTVPHFILQHNPVLSNLVSNVPCPNYTYQIYIWRAGCSKKKHLKHKKTSTHQLISSIAVLQSTGSTLELQPSVRFQPLKKQLLVRVGSWKMDHFVLIFCLFMLIFQVRLRSFFFEMFENWWIWIPQSWNNSLLYPFGQNGGFDRAMTFLVRNNLVPNQKCSNWGWKTTLTLGEHDGPWKNVSAASIMSSIFREVIDHSPGISPFSLGFMFLVQEVTFHVHS